MKNFVMFAAVIAFLCIDPSSLGRMAGGLSLTMDAAQAAVGHPLSAGSVAGVHRRAHRRAYRRGY